NGRVWEFGKDGKQRWEVTGMPGANDVQVLPGGRILVAERNSGLVTERNLKGTVLWKHTVPSPIAAQRLPNGNTLICTFNQLLEVTPDNKTVREHNNGSGFRHAVRLRNGHILYVTSGGNVVELDADWKQVRSFTPERHAQGAGYWASVELL